MKFYSTKNKNNKVTFRDAVIRGIAQDGGLYMPEYIPKLSTGFFQDFKGNSFQDVAFHIAREFMTPDLSEAELQDIIEELYTWPVPLVQVDDTMFSLELFHGPTLAFKDFGAGFMAKVLTHFIKNDNKSITVLVATSGDTGSAVAAGFHNQPGVNVILLYPSNMVSVIQEKQLTTWGGNIHALEIDGSFDDCQRLVKTAFQDNDINKQHRLSSANSINIARLLPQSFYYIYAKTQLDNPDVYPVFSVPSGNLGNLSAGLIASKMGMNVSRFIAALNANNTFQHYLESGEYEAQKTIPTLSNAMDVGDPSNFYRILDLYKGNHFDINSVIFSESFSDDMTKAAIAELYAKSGYILDPHGAVAYLALQEYMTSNCVMNDPGIILETAHPGKFASVVDDVLQTKTDIPQRLEQFLHKEKKAQNLSSDFEDFKTFLMEFKG